MIRSKSKEFLDDKLLTTHPIIMEERLNNEKLQTLKSKIKSTGNQRKRKGGRGPGHGERQRRELVGRNKLQ